MKEFRTENEAREPEELRPYLTTIDNTNNPFNCPNLRVLPEDIKIINPDRPSETYRAGTLICLYGVRYGLSRRCKVESPLTLREGSLEFTCNRVNGRFTTQLTKFEIIPIKK